MYVTIKNEENLLNPVFHNLYFKNEVNCTKKDKNPPAQTPKPRPFLRLEKLYQTLRGDRALITWLLLIT